MRVKFRLISDWRCTLTEAVDYFGKASLHISQERKGGLSSPAAYVGTVHVNYESMREFALRNTPCIEVIEPAELRDDLKEAYRAASERLENR